jgi:predicted nuclease with RNAse H fold
MSVSAQRESFFIGWDVGGWNCDKNPRSRDAIVILDSALTFVGQPWRGNLRECISSASTTHDWLSSLFSKCQAEFPSTSVQVTMAIDTPLGFSEEFANLVTDLKWTEPSGGSDGNPYLFRQTERHLLRKGNRPLSAVKDMIGSQATKGMHVLAKFAPVAESCGVWTDGKAFRAIETYPAACKSTKVVKQLRKGRKTLEPDDLNDALTCALIAHLFAADRAALEPPTQNVPHREGWIWVPWDVPPPSRDTGVN